jgi:phosphopantothenoylcysteine decarboxylase/phosphopantothenate--cysteine ligase
MRATVMSEIARADIFISVAAVADYRPAQIARQKLKKNSPTVSLQLTRNPDILSEVAALPAAPFTVGFAAETHAVNTQARDKLRAKNIDMIAANAVGRELGFDQEDNALQVIWEQGEQSLARADKRKLARQLVAIIAERYEVKRRGETHTSQEKVVEIHGKDSA